MNRALHTDFSEKPLVDGLLKSFAEFRMGAMKKCAILLQLFCHDSISWMGCMYIPVYLHLIYLSKENDGNFVGIIYIFAS